MAGQPPLTGDRQFRSQVVRISELTVNTSIIDGYTFSNCRIIGPAVLALLGNVNISTASFDASGVDGIFWEVPPARGPVFGAVGVRNCTFSNCAFELIGIAGPPELRFQLEAAFRAEP